MTILNMIIDKFRFYILKKELSKLEKQIDNLKKNTYSDFSEFEKSCLEIINAGTILREKILKYPFFLDDSSINVLSNKTRDLSFLSSDLKCFVKLFDLKKYLVSQYQIYLQKLINETDYQQAICICEQIFKLTGNYIFKMSIADIYLKKLNQPETSLKILKSIQPNMDSQSIYWWKFSDIYMALKNYYKQVECMQKAIEIELENDNV